MVRGPMMAEVTAGWRVANAIAIWMRVMPASSASAPSASAASSLAALAGLVESQAPGKRWARAAEPGPMTSWPLRYLPDSQPPASGLKVMTPIPWRRQVGSTSYSMARVSKE